LKVSLVITLKLQRLPHRPMDLIRLEDLTTKITLYPEEYSEQI